MSEIEMKIEAEAPEFTDELTDEALDRTEGDFLTAGHGATSTANGVHRRAER